MFQLVYTKKFKKDVDLLQKRGLNMEILRTAISILEENGILPAHFQPHKLSGFYLGFWEAHL